MNDETVRAMDTIARYYDLDLDGFDEDLSLYEAFAERSEGDVLEVGCGTGRVSAALASAGKTVVAVDVSQQMLRLAELRNGEFETVLADLRSLDLERRFGLVIAPLGTLLHIPTEDRPVAFRGIRRHLKERGLLVADLAVEADWSPGLQPLVCHWMREDPVSRKIVSKFVAIESDPTSLTQQVTYFFDETGSDGTVRRALASFDLHYFTESELRHCLEANGMTVEGLYGDYDLSPLAAESERMIVVAKAV